jgi:hypothetical protein
VADDYCTGKLVRVICGRYVAGLVIGRESRRVVVAAPILRHYLGCPEDKLRMSLRRLGLKATVVRDYE